MYKFSISILLLLLVSMSSCKSSDEKQTIDDDKKLIPIISDDKIRTEIKENAGIVIPSYTMCESKSDQAMGDYSESYVIKFDSLNFQNIVIQIKNSPYYMDVFNPSVPPNAVLKEEKLKKNSLEGVQSWDNNVNFIKTGGDYLSFSKKNQVENSDLENKKSGK